MIKRIVSTVCAVVIAAGSMLGYQALAPAQDVSVVAQALPSYVEKTLPMDRLSGSNRYETAAMVSQQAFPKGCSSVVIASGTDYADALCGNPLAKSLNAPLLLSEDKLLPAETEKEIKRLGAKTAFVIGGKGVISEAVKVKLQQNGLTVVRVAGKDRYETSVNVSTIMDQTRKSASLTAFFVSASDYPDALSVSAVAAIKNSPIFYVDKSGKLSDSVKNYLKSCKKKLGFAYIIGGSGAIDDKIFEELKPYFNESGRYGGANRYDTNAYINTAFRTIYKSKDVYLCTGSGFPDALAGAVLAAKDSAPLMLADRTVNDKQTEYLRNYENIKIGGKETLHIVGGEGAVANTAAQSVLMIEDASLRVNDGGKSATLVWGRNQYVTSYQILRDGKAITEITDPFRTTYVDTGITADASYQYTIKYNYTINGQKYLDTAKAELKRKMPEYKYIMNEVNTARLNSEKNNTPKYSFRTENAQGATSTNSYYDMRYLKTGDLATLEKFAREHFTNSMTKADKVAYTLNWINKNVWYGTVADGGWAILTAMANNGTFSYVNCIFNHKIGQCNCYNGALASMMLYLGYDAHLVMGYRGQVNGDGVITSKWQHFWCEVKINGQTYVMEAGNYGEDGDWMYLCELYKDVESSYTYTDGKKTKTGWHGYIKNGKVVL